MARRPERFTVIPCYSGGSPAQVDEKTARMVAQQEQDAHQRYLDGSYGNEAMIRARHRGLDGIVYSWREQRSGAVVTDLITGAVTTFDRFWHFQRWGQQQRARTANSSVVKLTASGAQYRVLFGKAGMTFLVDHWGDTPGVVHVRDYRVLPGMKGRPDKDYNIWSLGNGDWEILP